MIRKERSEQYFYSILKNKNYMDYVTGKIDAAISDISSESGIRTALNTYDTTMLEKHRDNYKNYVKKYFDSLENDFSFIDQSFLFVFDNKKVFSNKSIYELDIDNLTNSTIINDFLASDKTIFWFNTKASNLFKNAPNKNLLLTFQKVFHSQNEHTLIGFTISIIDPDSFNSIYVDKILDKDGKVLLVDTTENIEIDAFKKPIHINMTSLKSNIDSDIALKKIVFNNSNYYYTLLPLSNLNLGLLYIIPEDNLISSATANILKSSIYYIAILSLIICLIIIFSILILYKMLLSKETLNYKLLITEELNTKLRLYKHDFANHLQIISGLLELNRVSNAREYIRKTADEGFTITDVCPIGIPELESVILTSFKIAKKSNIDYAVQCIELTPEELPIKIYDLSKVLSNLLKNALYALEKFEGYDKKLSVNIYKSDEKYIFEIINSNPKIPEEIRKRIFEKNYTTKGSEGNGLGLFIVSSIVKKYNGSVSLVVNDTGNHFIVEF
jgi:signal transduction histidine kinase